MKWYISLFIASVSLTVGNKFLMHNYPYPKTIIFIQNFISILLLLLLVYSDFIKINKIDKNQLIECFIPAFYLFLQLTTSMEAMPYITIPTIVIFSPCLGF